MSSSKPGVFALSKEATHFVFSNVGLFFHHARVNLPLMLLCVLANQLGRGVLPVWSGLVISAFSLFFFACFALGWYRSSLDGPDKAHETNPFTLRREGWAFAGLFIIVNALYGLTMGGLSYVMKGVLPQYGSGIAALGGLVIVAATIFVFITYVRASFLFPPKSAGASMTWAEAENASKGMVWPVTGSWIIYMMLFTVVFAVYSFVALMILSIGGDTEGISPMQGKIISFVLTAPVMVAFLFCMALCITTTTRAYQWGVQNNRPDGETP